VNTQPIEQARDADLRMSQTAMQRAARRARELARETGTAIVVSRDGVIEHIMPQRDDKPVTVQDPSAPYGEKR
jgi:LDH2 family malate/lactate/ureidoglycolate dehydrogenase